METINIIITSIVSILSMGVGGVLGYILFFRSRKRKENADANKATHEADNVAVDGVKSAIKEWVEIANQYKKDYDKVVENQEKLKAQNEKILTELFEIKRAYTDLFGLLSANCVDCAFVSDEIKDKIKKKIK